MESLGNVVDLFSGGGGISYGFAAHPAFTLRGAADAEIGKPSTGAGAIGCNATYEANIGLRPQAIDLAKAPAEEVVDGWGLLPGESPTVLLACPPCTGFSRAVAKNHAVDDPRNSLVANVADYAEILSPEIIFMENVPQLLNGNFREHFQALSDRLVLQGYRVHSAVHSLNQFGLPQKRERALVVAAKKNYELHSLGDLWHGYGVSDEATTVRRAIGHLPAIAAGATDPFDSGHTCGALHGESLDRIKAIPRDGGSWPDLLGDERLHKYLIPSMWRSVEKGRLNSYRDIYGRMSWDRPAPTIKRECSHVGNGRYAHPEQDRPCSVRELGLLQGFPDSFQFVGTSRKNLYRQIGDAVPPLISYQLAWLASWILTSEKPDLFELILPGTSLRPHDLQARAIQEAMLFC